MEDKTVYDLIVIGSGAAGLSAGLYAGRYRMNTLIIGASFGGATSTAGIIHNYPGVPHAEGYELMKTMKSQCEELGVTIQSSWVTKIEQDGSCFRVTTGQDEKTKQFGAKTIVFAMGTERRKLGVDGEETFLSRGVHYCITCDGPLYGGKTIAIVGGGDGSVKGAILAAEYAEKIYLIVRGDELRAEPINAEMLKKLGNKVEVHFQTSVLEIHGEQLVNSVTLSKEINGTTQLPIDGIFIEIGADAQRELPSSLGVELDERGYIATDNLMKTNIPGIYAAGDTTNFFGSFKQDITAAATGAVAATSAYNYYKQHGALCEIHWVPVNIVD
ncbi:MAG: FAD-dependent oxidoreductase [bacterium]|nr:FAD-dependent oxidoreductase [bacterium]